jgi:hypothetical protein
MRTTIRIDDALLREAKQVAAQSGTSLTGLIEDAIREKLARRGTAARRTRVALPTVNGNGLAPGVDLDDASSLLDLMESSDAAS